MTAPSLWLLMLAGCGLTVPTVPEVPQLPTIADIIPSAAPDVPMDVPDLSGAWEIRGLLPVAHISLWALITFEREGSGNVWTADTTYELYTRDRIRKVGHATLNQATTFTNGQACTRHTQVTLELEPWLKELPLHDKVIDIFQHGGLDDQGCADVIQITADYLHLQRGQVSWDERRPR
jgi:hypothetical protein